MMKPLALLFGLMVVTVCADSAFTIWTPSGLVSDLDNTAQKMSIGNFGHVPWGKMVIGYVYAGSPENGCQPVNWTTHKFDRSPILIVRRGGCNFVTKAHNAQLAGARMLIVVHNESNVNLDMIDDESGQSESLHIPSVLISKSVGDKILANIEEGKHMQKPTPSRVSVVVSFEIAKAKTSNYEIWLSSSDRHSYQFIDKFYREYHYLKNDAKLTIRTVVNEHIGFEPYDKVRPNCLSGGRYCSTHPSTDKSFDGRENLLEDLRQHCIAEKSMPKFHDYLEKWGRECFEVPQMQACSEETMKKVKIDVEEIKKCVNETFEPKVTGQVNYDLDDNKYFRKELLDRRLKGISHWPTAYVNGISIRSTLTPDNLFETVCASLTNPPKECSYKEWDEEKRQSHDPNDYKKGNAFIIVLCVIVGLLVLFVLVFYFVYRRIVKQQLARELSLSVNSAVANYVKMNEGREAKAP